MPVFISLPTFEKQYGGKSSNRYDEDFEIEDDSIRKRFDQHELNDLVRHLGLSKKASELLGECLKKNCLKRERKLSNPM